MRVSGETDSVTTPSPAELYAYSLGYYPDSNVQRVTDSLMGSWSYTYDPLSRLSTAAATAGAGAGLTLTEGYDAFGNRKSQTASGSSAGAPQPAPVTFSGNNNRVDQWAYDAAGDVLNDGTNLYEYDAEGRQTGTYNHLSGLTGYVYDAEGQRVEKVQVNGFGTATPSTTVQAEYLLGPNGEQVSVLNGIGQWQWTNIYAGGKQVATYDPAGTHFTLTDWLGTKRVQVTITGASKLSVGEQCASLPFGDGLDCYGSDVNQLHFTGKERDTESGNDYFGARYYASNIAGRFLTPDPSRLSILPASPQTWNRYSYAYNSPLSLKDGNGKWPTKTHNQIIDKSFPNLTPAQQQILKNASSISNLYYPATNSSVATVTYENALITIGSSGVTNLFQEFLIRKLTPHASSSQPGQP